MKLSDYLRLFPEQEALNQRSIPFCRYLEQRGKRFCIDFGFLNAEDMTWAELEREYDDPPLKAT